MAQTLNCKFIFDEHITKVIVDNQSLSTTTSGTTLQFSKGGSDTYVTNACTVELEEGYVLNTVVGDGEKLTDTTFNANFYDEDSSSSGYVKDYGTVTLTSKMGGYYE